MQSGALPPAGPAGARERLRLHLGCEFTYTTDAPVSMLLLVRPRTDGASFIMRESRWSEPEAPWREYRDGFGNTCWRLTAPGGPIVFGYDAVVEVSADPDPIRPQAQEVPVEDLPDDTLVFTLPSRYIQSDLLLNVAWELFGAVAPGWQRVQAICDWVHHNVRFEAGSTVPTTTACDIYAQRTGVCRDFALLAIAFCRALNIPARYTFGYLPDIGVVPSDTPMDFHTWFEVFLDDRWHTFDARHNVPRIGRVIVGRGRDAVDVALTTSYGDARLEKMLVWTEPSTPTLPDRPRS